MLAAKDIEQQLAHMINSRFITETDSSWLEHIPRFLEGIKIRLTKLERSPSVDKDRYAQVAVHWKNYLDISEESTSSAQNEEFIKYRWMLEEMRISLFAQELNTSMPISIKRLDTQFEKYKKSLVT